MEKTVLVTPIDSQLTSFVDTVTVNPTPVISNIEETFCTGSTMAVAPVNGNGNAANNGAVDTRSRDLQRSRDRDPR